MKSFLFAGFSAANPTNKSRIGGGFSTSFDSISASLLAFLPLKLLLILLCVTNMAFGQFDLSLSASGGLSKLNGQRFQNENIESNFRFSTGLDLLVQLNKNKHI